MVLSKIESDPAYQECVAHPLRRIVRARDSGLVGRLVRMDLKTHVSCAWVLNEEGRNVRYICLSWESVKTSVRADEVLL